MRTDPRDRQPELPKDPIAGQVLWLTVGSDSLQIDEVARFRFGSPDEVFGIPQGAFGPGLALADLDQDGLLDAAVAAPASGSPAGDGVGRGIVFIEPPPRRSSFGALTSRCRASSTADTGRVYAVDLGG